MTSVPWQLETRKRRRRRRPKLHRPRRRDLRSQRSDPKSLSHQTILHQRRKLVVNNLCRTREMRPSSTGWPLPKSAPPKNQPWFCNTPMEESCGCRAFRLWLRWRRFRQLAFRWCAFRNRLNVEEEYNFQGPNARLYGSHGPGQSRCSMERSVAIASPNLLWWRGYIDSLYGGSPQGGRDHCIDPLFAAGLHHWG